MSFIPSLPTGPFTDKEGNLTPMAKNFFDTLLINLREGISNEGFLIPSQVQRDINVIEEKAQPGTVLFNTALVNGGSTDSPNGQLIVMLADGSFHEIPNL